MDGSIARPPGTDPMRPIRVYLAEAHETVRHGLKLVIGAQPDMEVVGEASTGRQAVEEALRASPDVILIDVSMPGMNGLDATQRLCLRRDHPAVVALTRHSDGAFARAMLAAGAAGYVLKQSSSDEMLRAIRAAASGRQYLDRSIAASAEPFGPPARRGAVAQAPQPTGREVDVLRRMAKGYSNKEIAAALGISVKTVEVHKANGMRKLGLRSRIDIVRYAVLQGWLSDT